MIRRPIVTERREERADDIEVLLGLRVMMQGREDARDALGRRRCRKAGEESGAFPRVCEPAGEDAIESGERRRDRSRGEIAASVVECGQEAVLDRPGERGRAFRCEPFGHLFHGSQQLCRHDAGGENRAQVRELLGGACFDVVSHGPARSACVDCEAGGASKSTTRSEVPAAAGGLIPGSAVLRRSVRSATGDVHGRSAPPVDVAPSRHRGGVEQHGP